ncbi:hypothetical protein E2P81_ATG09553 [Venturia nashicola]|nr:hypothetical protein E2P81_ATG09553 [Venturia nashicola]
MSSPKPDSFYPSTELASFSSLPRELRQAILLYTCEGDNTPDSYTKALLWQTSGYPLFDYWHPFKKVDFRTRAEIIEDVPPWKRKAKGRFCRSEYLLNCADRWCKGWIIDAEERARSGGTDFGKQT